MSRHWHVTIVLEDQIWGPYVADTASEAEQQIRDNIRDYLHPGNVVSVDAERIGVEEIREWAPSE